MYLMLGNSHNVLLLTRAYTSTLLYATYFDNTSKHSLNIVNVPPLMILTADITIDFFFILFIAVVIDKQEKYSSI